jgi:hypothetical protein
MPGRARARSAHIARSCLERPCLIRAHTCDYWLLHVKSLIASSRLDRPTSIASYRPQTFLSAHPLLKSQSIWQKRGKTSSPTSIAASPCASATFRRSRVCPSTSVLSFSRPAQQPSTPCRAVQRRDRLHCTRVLCAPVCALFSSLKRKGSRAQTHAIGRADRPPERGVREPPQGAGALGCQICY